MLKKSGTVTTLDTNIWILCVEIGAPPKYIVAVLLPFGPWKKTQSPAHFSVYIVEQATKKETKEHMPMPREKEKPSTRALCFSHPIRAQGVLEDLEL